MALPRYTKQGIYANAYFTMIEIKELHKSYSMGKSTLHVLKGINFNVAEGEMVAIMGSSGSGKSTLLNILGMLDVAEEGTYNLDGKVIKDLDETKAAIYRNKFLGFVFQSFNLISYKTALENVMLPLYYQKISRKERQKSAQKYLEDVGLGPWASHHPNELSGGQKQRVAIARALVSEPKVLLADEPTGALDTKTSYELMDLLQKINDAGKTLLIVTHEQDIANMCKRIVHLRDGVIVEDKKVNQVKASQYVE
jgi:putative ABC transport system ATP-binding protein